MTATANTTDLREAYLARLTTAAYQAALQHGVKGSSIDLELTMWRALRGEMCRTGIAGDAPSGEVVAAWGT